MSDAGILYAENDIACEYSPYLEFQSKKLNFANSECQIAILSTTSFIFDKFHDFLSKSNAFQNIVPDFLSRTQVQT
jgi:hypothetical protein